MNGAARFFNQTMVKEGKHSWWVVCPSLSPENQHPGGATTAAGVTMDNELVRDLFTHVIDAASILNDNSNTLIDSLKTELAALPPLQIGKWGQLQEWMDDWDNPQDNHRHVSHLYGLYPSNQISPFSTLLSPMLPARRSSIVETSLQVGAWVGKFVCGHDCLMAIMLETHWRSVVIGEKREETWWHLSQSFDAHPPFQIDGNFGCTAGSPKCFCKVMRNLYICCLLLPDDWHSGSVSGLKARGGYEVSINWKNNKLQSAKSSHPSVARSVSVVPCR